MFMMNQFSVFARSREDKDCQLRSCLFQLLSGYELPQEATASVSALSISPLACLLSWSVCNVVTLQVLP